MNLYLLTFKQGNRVVNAWHRSPNAGEAIDLIEDKGIDVIKTVKVKQAFHCACQMTYPDLPFWLRILESDLRYKELQQKQPQEGITKLAL